MQQFSKIKLTENAIWHLLLKLGKYIYQSFKINSSDEAKESDLKSGMSFQIWNQLHRDREIYSQTLY